MESRSSYTFRFKDRRPETAYKNAYIKTSCGVTKRGSSKALKEYYNKYEEDSADVWEQEKALSALQTRLRQTETGRVTIGHKYGAFKSTMIGKIEGMVSFTKL